MNAGSRVLLTLCVLLAAGSACAGSVCRVAPDGHATASGATWQSAMSFHAALSDTACVTIWLKEGLYKPNQYLGDIGSSFYVRPGVSVYGGFRGTEVTFADRVLSPQHPTVLSGDVGNDDIVDEYGITRSWKDIRADLGSRGDRYYAGYNSAAVVSMAPPSDAISRSYLAYTIIDGVVITAGQSAIYGKAEMFSPTFRHVLFVGNGAPYSARRWATVSIVAGLIAPVFESVTFAYNYTVPSIYLSIAVPGIWPAGGYGATRFSNTTFAHNTTSRSMIFTRGHATYMSVGNSTIVDNHTIGPPWSVDWRSKSGVFLFLVDYTDDPDVYYPSGAVSVSIANSVLWNNTARERRSNQQPLNCGTVTDLPCAALPWADTVMVGVFRGYADYLCDPSEMARIVDISLVDSIMPGGGVPVTNGNKKFGVNQGSCEWLGAPYYPLPDIMTTADLIDEAPRLSYLRYHNRYTMTMLPQPGSPIVGAAGTTACTEYDQRGLYRMASGCSIGATEPDPAIAVDRIFDDNFGYFGRLNLSGQ